MSFNYDELYAKYTDWLTSGVGSQEDLLWHLDGDIENWAECDCDPSELTGLYGIYTREEVIWLHKCLTQAVNA